MPAVTPRIVVRLLVTVLLIAVFRLGQYVPLPYTDASAVTPDSGPVYGLMELVSGGAVGRLSLFALGVYPQFIALAVLARAYRRSPRLQMEAAGGPLARRRLMFRVLVLSVAAAAVLGAAVAAAGASGYFGDGAFSATGLGPMALVVACLAAATAVMFVLTECLDRFGCGPSITMLALVPLFAGLTEGFTATADRHGPLGLGVLLAAVLVAVVARVLTSQSQRRIPIGYAKRMVGRRPGVTPTYLPVHLVVAGDKSLLIAAVVALVPTLAAELAGLDWLGFWDARDPRYMVAFALVAGIVTLWRTTGRQNPAAYADELRRTGGFVPGIRPGPWTGEYLWAVVVRLAAAGTVFWVLGATVPLVAAAILGAGAMSAALLPVVIFYTVEAALRTGREIQTESLMRHYAGMLR